MDLLSKDNLCVHGGNWTVDHGSCADDALLLLMVPPEWNVLFTHGPLQMEHGSLDGLFTHSPLCMDVQET